MLTHPCISGITWSWYMILLRYCWIWFSNIVFCKDFYIYVCQGFWPIIFFFCDIYLVLAPGWYWSYKMSSEAFLLLQFFSNSLRRIGVNCSLNGKSSGHGLFFFLVGSFGIIDSTNFILVIRQFIFSLSSWFSLGRLYISRNFSVSFRLSILFLYSFSE